MTLQTQSFTTTVNNFAAAVQGAASSLLNFTIGSVLRAIADAVAGVAMWLQGLIISLLAVTRLSTSSGTDVDSFLADFGFARLPATSASGLVTISRLTNTAQAVVPVGTIVQSSDGTQQYILNADATNPAYSATVVTGGGFVIPAGTSSISVTATALTPGVAANVAAGTINALVVAIPYVDTVSNPSAFTNGASAEADAAVKARFVLWLNSLAEGTLAAVKAAITGVQQGLTYSITENTLFSGGAQPGTFTVVIDDGTGYPSTTLQNSVGNAINAVRPLCSSFSVHAPSVVSVPVVMVITTAAGFVHANVAAIVQSALTAYINSIGIGASLSYTKLAQVAYEASTGVTAVVAGYTVNGGTSDISVTSFQVIKVSTCTVS